MCTYFNSSCSFKIKAEKKCDLCVHNERTFAEEYPSLQNNLRRPGEDRNRVGERNWSPFFRKERLGSNKVPWTGIDQICITASLITEYFIMGPATMNICHETKFGRDEFRWVCLTPCEHLEGKEEMTFAKLLVWNAMLLVTWMLFS